VGDAALALDPLSSGGIHQALRSGMFAARAAEDFLCGDSSGLAKYESFLAAESAGYLQTRAQVYGREARFAGSPFWERRRG
jgi:flavin-dependent dehydrogenase